ncbi:MAG: DMT family transporter [Patescibacteria group bacterium]|nr:DMT family transporter [Patescibacteria group bacterium]
MPLTETQKGDLFVFSEAVLWAFFPVVTALTLKFLPPFASLAYSSLFAAVFFAAAMLVRGKFSELRRRGIWTYVFLSVFFIGWLFYGLFFVGLKFTTAGNAGIISLMELFFSYLWFVVWKKEEFLRAHTAGAVLMLAGAVIILFPKRGLSFHGGDLIILAATACAPLGNYYQQKLRRRISSETMMFLRSLLTFPVFFGALFIFRLNPSGAALRGALWLLLLNGTLLLGLSKIFWLEAIHRITVTKANALASVGPFFTLIFAYMILGERPEIWQWLSLVPIATGTWLLTA